MAHKEFQINSTRASPLVLGKEGMHGGGYRNKPKTCSKDVSFLMGNGKAALRGRSQETTVGGRWKSARQSGSSDGLRVSVI